MPCRRPRLPHTIPPKKRAAAGRGGGRGRGRGDGSDAGDAGGKRSKPSKPSSRVDELAERWAVGSDGDVTFDEALIVDVYGRFLAPRLSQLALLRSSADRPSRGSPLAAPAPAPSPGGPVECDMATELCVIPTPFLLSVSPSTQSRPRRL